MADRIVEAQLRVTGKDLTGGAFDSIAKKIDGVARSTKSIAGLAGKMEAVSRGTSALRTHAEAVGGALEKLSRIDAFRSAHSSLIGSRVAFRDAQANVQRLAKEMASAASPTAKLQNDFKSAQRAVSAAATSFDQNRAAVRAAREELARYGVTLKNIGAQTAAAKRIADRRGVYDGSGPLARIPLPGGKPLDEASRDKGGVSVIGGGGKLMGAAAAGLAVKAAHDKIVENHHDFQQAYLYQQAVLGISPETQKALLDQATKIGQDTKFSNADIVKAQTDIGSKLPKDLQNPGSIAAITEHTKNYALAMRVSMEEGAEAVVAWMKGRGYDLSSPQAAERSARRAANQMVEFAKTTGAKHHDMIGDIKFGAASGRAAGFSEEFANSLSAQLIRLGYEGAMAGTFVRAAGMKLTTPTLKGMAAISAAGLNFDDYVKPGNDPSVGGLDKMLRQRFGRGLSKSQTAELRDAFNEEATRSDRGTFVERVSEILNSSFARKTKDGKVNAQDAERIAKVANDFHTLSAQGVDSERLMTDLVKRGITPAIAKYLFGTEHGGRVLGLNADQLGRDLKNFQNVPDNRAEQVGTKMQEGAQGEYTKMIGSMQTFAIVVGEATDGLRSFTYKGIAAMFDQMTKAVRGEAAVSVDPTRDTDGKKIEWSGKGFDPLIFERARRAQDEIRRDPEAARGRAMREVYGNSGAIEATVKPDQIRAKLDGTVPVDVTGKVDAELKGQANVSVTVKVQGGGQVVGMSASSSGHVKANVGTSMQGSGE